MNALATQTTVVLVGFFGLSFLLGVLCQRTHFCTMGAIADVLMMGDWRRARQWQMAVAVAMLGFAALVLLGLIDPTLGLYDSPRILWLSGLVGGLAFGWGMVMASGCGNKILVRVGGVNLKSLIVLLVMGLVAFMTLKGLTAVWRAGFLDPFALTLAPRATLATLLLPGLDGQAGLWLGLVLGGLWVLVLLRDPTQSRAELLATGGGVGLLVVLAWWWSGHVGYVAEHPETLETMVLATGSGRMEALSFVAPVAQTLDWLLFYSDTAKRLTVGMMSVCGLILGAAASAVWRGEFRWEGFTQVEDMRRHLLGAALMGFGGVTAMGCTFGQGISALSTLSLQALVSTPAIVLGAVLALRRQMALLERS